jgi:hypothetical protein
MKRNTERILVVHSVLGTEPAEIGVVEEAIRSFERTDSSVRAVPVVFAIPAGAAPGSTLGTELNEELRSCIGALIFVDDLRPNVAYELGFFHGEARPSCSLRINLLTVLGWPFQILQVLP